MAKRRDPYGNYNFMIELNGLTRTDFKDCSGIESSIDSFDYRESTDPGNITHKLPAQRKASTITLKRGLADDRALWDWHHKAASGNVERHTISIMLWHSIGNTDTGARSQRQTTASCVSVIRSTARSVN
jgi:phage tail-like protein